MTNTRYITVLNVIACFFVIILHVFEPNFSTTPSWVFEELFRAIAYCAVPIFFMITGATLLDYRDRYDTKTYFKKRLLKTVIPFVFWSIVYFIINLVSGKINTSELSFSYIFNYFVTVKTNPIFWFFMVIFAIYLAIPVISLIPKENRESCFRYIIIITFIFNSFIPYILSFTNLAYNNDLRFPLTASSWILFVFVGYYLSHYELENKWRYLLYGLGLLGFSTMFFGTWIYSYCNNGFVSMFGEYYEAPALLYSASIFLLFSRFKFENKFFRVFEFVAPTTLGVYVLHIAIRDLARYLIPISGFFPNLLATISIFLICVMFIKLIQLIPGVKYIVP